MVSELDGTLTVSLPERTFAIWADYWIRMGFLVPPIVIKRYGLHSDVVFHPPMGRAELESFISAVRENRGNRLPHGRRSSNLPIPMVRSLVRFFCFCPRQNQDSDLFATDTEGATINLVSLVLA